MPELPYYHRRSLQGKAVPLTRSPGNFHRKAGTLLILILIVFATICLTTLYYIPEISHPDEYVKVYNSFTDGSSMNERIDIPSDSIGTEKFGLDDNALRHPVEMGLKPVLDLKNVDESPVRATDVEKSVAEDTVSETGKLVPSGADKEKVPKEETAVATHDTTSHLDKEKRDQVKSVSSLMNEMLSQ